MKSDNKIRAFNKKLASSNGFNIFILFLIVLNVVLVLLETIKKLEYLRSSFIFLEVLILALFVLELIIRIISSGGLRSYFRNDDPLVHKQKLWNIFDFSVIILAIIGFILLQLDVSRNIHILIILRIFRITRFLFFFELYVESHHQILIFRISRLIQLFTFYLLGTFCFSIFSLVLFDGSVNFSNILESMYSLFRVSTFNGESIINNNENFDIVFSKIFFISYILFSILIYINIIALITKFILEDDKRNNT